MAIQATFIQGTCVSLRPLLEEDAPRVMNWLHDPEIRLMTGDIFPRTLECIKKMIKEGNKQRHGESLHLGITSNRENDQIIGLADLTWIGWTNRGANFVLSIGNKDARRKGFAKEATQLLLEYLFSELNLHKVSCWIPTDYSQAISLVEGIGMKHEITFHKQLYYNRAYHDQLKYMIFERDWAVLRNIKAPVGKNE